MKVNLKINYNGQSPDSTMMNAGFIKIVNSFGLFFKDGNVYAVSYKSYKYPETIKDHLKFRLKYTQDVLLEIYEENSNGEFINEAMTLLRNYKVDAILKEIE